jgi:hypothetical protein
LFGIEVNTEDLNALRLNPERFAVREEDIARLHDLFLLMDMAQGKEEPLYGDGTAEYSDGNNGNGSDAGTGQRD